MKISSTLLENMGWKFERETPKHIDLTHTDRECKGEAIDLQKLFKGENTQGQNLWKCPYLEGGKRRKI